MAPAGRGGSLAAVQGKPVRLGHQQRAILTALRKHGPMTNTDLAQHLSASLETVSNATKRLREANMIRTTRERFANGRDQVVMVHEAAR